MNNDRAYWRASADERIRKESVDFAIRILKALPASFKKPIAVLDFARLISSYVKEQLEEDIAKLPSDIVQGLREKYGDNESYRNLL